MLRAYTALVCWLLLLVGCAQHSEPSLPAPDATLSKLPLRWWEGLQDARLNRLVQLTLRDNLDVAAAVQRIREQRAARHQAGGDLFPSLQGKASKERVRDFNTGNDGQYFYGFDLSWELDLFGRLHSIERAAERREQAAVADYQALRVSLIGEVASDYLNFLEANREAAIAQKTADSQEETFRMTRVRYAQGTASQFDVERLQAEVESTRAAVPEARKKASQARYAIAYLLNRPQPEIDALLAGAADLPKLPGGEQLAALLELPANSLRGRPDVRSKELELRASAADLDAAKALRYPTLTLSALLGMQQGPVNPSGTRGLEAVQPLLDFGRIRAQIEVSGAKRQQAWLAYQNALIGALRDTRTAIAAYAEESQRLTNLERAEQSSRNAMDLAGKQYAAGTVSLLEVLDAQRTLFGAQTSRQQASADLLLRWVEIYRNLGLAPEPREQGQRASL